MVKSKLIRTKEVGKFPGRGDQTQSSDSRSALRVCGEVCKLLIALKRFTSGPDFSVWKTIRKLLIKFQRVYESTLFLATKRGQKS